MFYSITCLTKIHTLFITVGFPCKFVILLDVYVYLSRQIYTSSNTLITKTAPIACHHIYKCS